MAIKIKPSHRGLFTRKAKAHGESVQQYADQVLRPGSKASPATRKQANFAHNFGRPDLSAVRDVARGVAKKSAL